MASSKGSGFSRLSSQWEKEIREGFWPSRSDTASVRFVMSNIAEGFERSSDREFHDFSTCKRIGRRSPQSSVRGDGFGLHYFRGI